jgi:hypothetical protein
VGFNETKSSIRNNPNPLFSNESKEVSQFLSETTLVDNLNPSKIIMEEELETISEI